MHERNHKKAKSLCFPDVHNNFKANFDVHIYSVFPADQMENTIDCLVYGGSDSIPENRWLRFFEVATTLFILQQHKNQKESGNATNCPIRSSSFFVLNFL